MRPARAVDIFSHPLAIAGLYLLVSLFFTWPLLLHFGDAVPAGGDAWQNIWNLWWVRRSVETFQWPLHTELKYYPYGVNLYFDTVVPLAGWLGTPLQWLGLNLLSTYNLMVLLSFALAGLGAYLLARYLTAAPLPSFVAGFIFAFSPYHLSHLYGHLNLLWIQWLPFYILFLLKATDQADVGERRFAPTDAGEPPIHNSRFKVHNSLLAGLFLALTAYSEWTYVAFLGLFTIFFLLYRWWAVRHGGWQAVGRLLRPALVTGVVFVVLTAPVLLGFINELRSVKYPPLPLTETMYYSADLYAYITPSTLHPIFGAAVASLGERFDDPPSDLIVTPGITVIMLGLAALLLVRERRVRFWGWCVLIFLILSLGPILHIASSTAFTDFNGSMTMPYALLYQLPLFNVMRTPLRFAVLVALALAVLVAYTLRYMQTRHLNIIARYILPALILGLISFEYITVPPPMVEPPQPLTFYRQISTEAGNFAVVELPLRPMVDYLYYQTISGKPIVGGHLARQPIDKFAEEQPALRYLAEDTPADKDAEVTDGKGAAALAAAGVRYVAVHWWALTPTQRTTLERKLRAVFGNQQPTDYKIDQMSVYKTAP